MYAAWRREQVQALLQGSHGREVAELRATLRRLAPDAAQPLSGRDLVELVSDAAWLRGADAATRRGVGRMIAAALVWAREKRGLPPWDDPCPGEPESAGQAIQEMLRVRVPQGEEDGT